MPGSPDQARQQPDADPFAQSERASDEQVEARRGAPMGTATEQADPASGDANRPESDESPFARSTPASPEDVAKRAAPGPSHLDDGDR